MKKACKTTRNAGIGMETALKKSPKNSRLPIHSLYLRLERQPPRFTLLTEKNMKKTLLPILLIAAACFPASGKDYPLSSPNGEIQITLSTGDTLSCQVAYKGMPLFEKCHLNSWRKEKDGNMGRTWQKPGVNQWTKG